MDTFCKKYNIKSIETQTTKMANKPKRFIAKFYIP